MTATADISLSFKNVAGMIRNDHPVAAATKIYAGTAVGEAAGVARPLQAGDTYLGHSVCETDNSTGAAGDLNVEVVHGVQARLTVLTAAATSIGAAVYASADDTYTLESSGNSLIGYVRQHVSGTVCLVELIASRG